MFVLKSGQSYICKQDELRAIGSYGRDEGSIPSPATYFASIVHRLGHYSVTVEK